MTGRVEIGGRRGPPARRPDRDRDRLHPEGQQGIAIAGIARFQHPHTGAGFEERQERQREPSGRAGDHQDPLQVDAVVAVGEPTAQRVQPGGVGVPERLVEVGANRVASQLRQRRRRLTNLEVQYPAPRCLERRRLTAHRHGMERRYRGGTERGLDHRPILALGP